MGFVRQVLDSYGTGRLLLNRRFRHTARWFILPVVVIVLAAFIFPVVGNMAEFIGLAVAVLIGLYLLIDSFVDVPHPNFHSPRGPLVVPPPHVDSVPGAQYGPRAYGEPYWAPPAPSDR